ncbi:hypothetical protein [Actinotalea soli]|uniref:hypothetical protein n=1 Tax=Actinotalea soli TaxID=2819234 RepID=UPI0027DC5119|nr:hypothetical protein [Actinotalea soli]
MTSDLRSRPVARHDEAAARRLWDEYRAAQPGLPAEEPVIDHVGDSAGLADELLGLVLHGPRRATASLVVEFVEAGEPLPRLVARRAPALLATGPRGPGRAVARGPRGGLREVRRGVAP